jgi:hypothetical protein
VHINFDITKHATLRYAILYYASRHITQRLSIFFCVSTSIDCSYAAATAFLNVLVLPIQPWRMAWLRYRCILHAWIQIHVLYCGTRRHCQWSAFSESGHSVPEGWVCFFSRCSVFGQTHSSIGPLRYTHSIKRTHTNALTQTHSHKHNIVPFFVTSWHELYSSNCNLHYMPYMPSIVKKIIIKGRKKSKGEKQLILCQITSLLGRKVWL